MSERSKEEQLLAEVRRLRAIVLDRNRERAILVGKIIKLLERELNAQA